MTSRAPPKTPSEDVLFTMDFIVSIGGDDSHENQEMIHTLNLITSLWGPVAVAQMAKFLNLVKSKTDPLAVTLQAEYSTAKASIGAAGSGAKRGSNRSHEAEQNELQQPTKELESKLALAQREITDLKKQNHELTRKAKSVCDMAFDGLINTYNRKCIELELLRDESVQNWILFNEHNSAFTNTKAKLEKRIIEKDTLISKLEIQTKNKTHCQDRTDKMLRISPKMLVDPSEEDPMCCPVPMRNGGLVSLKYVYGCWKQVGVEWIPEDQLYPPFNGLLSTDPTIKTSQTLSDSSQIQNVHAIFLHFGFPHNPPFKIQFKDDDSAMVDDDEGWTDIIFHDQIRIASVMYYMKHKQSDTSCRITERRIVHQNQLLVTISLLQETFTFEIKKASLEQLQPIDCRVATIDPTFDLYKD